MAVPITINHIDQLSQCSDKGLPAILDHNAECVFKSNHDDLTKILDTKVPSVLNNIKKTQLNTFAEICPEFPAELAIPRTVVPRNKHALVQDILLLGNSIVAKAPVNKIETLVYSIPDKFDLSNPEGVKNAVTYLLKTTQEQKSEIGSLKNDKEFLSNELAKTQCELALIKAGFGLDDPIEHDIVQTDNDVIPVADISPSSEFEGEPRPVRGAIKTTDVFIGDVLPPCSVVDIQNHIKTKTSVTPKMTDIHNLKVRGENLAFKVTVPKNKFHEVTAESVWGSSIRAELYNPQKQNKPRTPKGAKSNNNNNKRVNRNRTFRNQNPNSKRPNGPVYYPNDWSSPSRDQSYPNRFHRDRYEPQYRDQYEPQYWYERQNSAPRYTN